MMSLLNTNTVPYTDTLEATVLLPEALRQISLLAVPK